MRSDACAFPAAPGVNTTGIVQVPPEASDVPQAELEEKLAAFGPVMLTLRPVSVAAPEFDTVTVWLGDAIPTGCSAKFSDAGESVTGVADPGVARLLRNSTSWDV
jgi:hypothetical protein